MPVHGNPWGLSVGDVVVAPDGTEWEAEIYLYGPKFGSDGNSYNYRFVRTGMLVYATEYRYPDQFGGTTLQFKHKGGFIPAGQLPMSL